MTTYDDTALQSLLASFVGMFTGPERRDMFEAVGRRVGVAAEAAIPEYPPQTGNPLPKVYQRTTAPRWVYRKVNGRRVKTGVIAKGGEPRAYLSKWKTGRQQRYVWWALSNGIIKPPYRRTGTLGKSINSQVLEATENGVSVAVGTNIKYAPWVIDRNQQSQYHTAGNWWTLQGAIEDAGATIGTEAARALTGEIKRRVAQ